MKIKSELEVLDIEVRARIIREIDQPENRARKAEALKRHEIYKDLTRKYVIDSLNREFEDSTVIEMQNRAANVSIAKKIVNKKARVYKNGAIRTVDLNDEIKEKIKDDKALAEKVINEQKKIDKMYELVQGNQNMKKSNRFLELHKNTAIQIVPLQDEDGKYYLKMRILPGHTYDVVENANDVEKAMVYILSHFLDRDSLGSADIASGGDGRDVRGGTSSFRSGDSKDQTIADSEADLGTDNRRHVWSTKSFSFTTDTNGQFINPITDEVMLTEFGNSPEDILMLSNMDELKNDIGMQSIISLNKDQDGNYWSHGGEDLTEGAVLINVLLTDLYFIAKVQGMGVFYAIGPDVPKTFKVGPNQGITIDTKDQEQGAGTPTVGFATANPPLDSHMKMIEQYIALLLSTNDLASSTVQGKLDASNAASGISDLIVRAEVTSAIEDDQQIFNDAEPKIFKVLKAWQNWLVTENHEVQEGFDEIGQFNDETNIKVKFRSFEEFQTEEQKLTISKMRIDLGIDSMVDAIMRDNPDLSEGDAELKLAKILKLKLERSSELLMGAKKVAEDNEEESEDENDEETEDES